MLRIHRFTAKLIFAGLFLVLFFPQWVKAAGPNYWPYTISDIDTPEIIDFSKTNAEINTSLHFISLKKQGIPNSLAFSPDGEPEYIVLTTYGVQHFSFDGTMMKENMYLSISGLDNPVGLAVAENYPDIYIAKEDGSIVNYKFSGTSMIAGATEAGFNGILSISGSETGGLAVLSEEGITRYLFDGTGIVPVPELSPELEGVTHPLAIAVGSGYDIAVLQEDSMRYFSFNGASLKENPFLEIAGLSGASSFAVDGETNTVTVLENSQINRYTLNGDSMQKSTIVSAAKLTAPAAIACRPGTFDVAVIDGETVRYFAWDGNEMVEIPELAVTVENIAKSDKYRKKGVAISHVFNTQDGEDADSAPDNVNFVRVSAFQDTPPGTSVTWSVSADGGTTWVTRWRVSGLEDGSTLAEVTDDNGKTWEPIGSGWVTAPEVNNPELWAEVTPGHQICWKAELATTDNTVTPVIFADIVLEAGNRPVVELDPVPGWFYITTPTFTWSFNDPDGDIQSGYQLVVRRLSDGSIVFDSGVVTTAESSCTLQTSQDPAVPGPLWASGTYEFTVELRALDSTGIPSDWTPAQTFRVLAFERPRISFIASAPSGQVKPVPEDETTHIMITPGMTSENLPKVKTGSKVTLVLDSVGPIETVLEVIARFPYLGREAEIENASAENPGGSPVNRWIISFFTEASKEIVPDGTIVDVHARGYNPVPGWTEFGTTGEDTTNGILTYADGVVITEGSVYEDWQVILRGRD